MISAEEVSLQNLYASKKRYGGEEMDELRQKEIAYQYLCRLEEAKNWMEAVLHEKLPPTTEMEEGLRNGVYLAKLAHIICPESLPINRIYDIDQKKYQQIGLQYRHTDNINYWIHLLEEIKLSKLFHPETNDIYNKKNMPRVIYCIHALSRHLFRLGKAPLISDLYGQAYFTDEEINAMSRELKKYGLQMPAFQKIGGLLANDIPVDSAALHAAIMLINNSLEEQNTSKLLSALQNPTACLNNVMPDYIDKYHSTMKSAKDKKIEVTLNKSQSDSFQADVYDELLTQAEIQGHITSVNVWYALSELKSAIDKKDEKALYKALKLPTLDLKAIQEKYLNLYMQELKESIIKVYNNDMDSLECRILLQKAITAGNNSALDEVKASEAVWQVNNALSSGGPVDTLRALQNPALGLYELIPEASPLYHEEMKADKTELGASLGYSEIRNCIHFLNHLAAITHAVGLRNPELTWSTLLKLNDMLDLEESFKDKYFKALTECKLRKKRDNQTCPLLNFFDVSDCIKEVNNEEDERNRLLTEMHNLNNALMGNNPNDVFNALSIIATLIHEKTDIHELPLYMKILKEILIEKESSELWLQDIQQTLTIAKRDVSEARRAIESLKKLNIAIADHDQNKLLEALEIAPIDVEIYVDALLNYLKLFVECRKQKVAKNYTCVIVVHLTRNSHKVYLNLKENEYTWQTPECEIEKSPYLSLTEAEKLVKMVNKEIIPREKDSTAPNETEMQLIQLIIKIQSWWRGVLARRYLKQLKEMHLNDDEKETNRRMEYFKKHVKSITNIQALWRGYRARKGFQSLLHRENPSIAVIRQFISLLNPTKEEFEREKKLQQLKSQVVTNIRLNQQLSQKIDDMDVKIGLLIQNRISLHDVHAHSMDLSDIIKQDPSSMSKGLKSLTKEGRHYLEGYQNLFYLLQTRPQYLSKLLFCLPQSKSMHFLESVIFTLFNFGQSQRDEYLLLKLIRSALDEELKTRVQKPVDALTYYPQVLKIAVNFSRQHSGTAALRHILEPLIEKVLHDDTLSIETNPVEIYKSWINNVEMTTGKPSSLPRNVNQVEALKYPEVQKRLADGISALEYYTSEFLDHICASRDQLPYSLLYSSKALYDSLAKRFIGFPEKDLLKVIGNVVYYHFINAAIVAPDAYKIISLPANKTLTTEERSNLASIAKILQYASAKKGFGEESQHLTCLNTFIIECHEKFKTFFTHCCKVEELEEHFGIHSFSEETMITKPSITIPLQELLETHELIEKYEDEIAPNQNDPLHSLLEYIGPLSSVRSLLAGSNPEGHVLKGEILITLNNTRIHQSQTTSTVDEPNHSQLFTTTKDLLISILPFLQGNDLQVAIDAPELPQHEQQFAKRQELLHKDPSQSLRLSKMRLRLWLSQLERQGLVSSKNNYQALISSIVKDIITRGKYCQDKIKELQTLQATITSLEQKQIFYKQQAESYNTYIKTCLESFDSGKRRVHQLKMSSKHPGKVKYNKTLKYSGAKLHEKGVITQIRGLNISQFKSVQFEIKPTSNLGVFEIKGCFMGIEIETVDICMQQLLQLQFENKAILDMFGKVQINVNLLLFLLNKKFYGKS